MQDCSRRVTRWVTRYREDSELLCKNLVLCTKSTSSSSMASGLRAEWSGLLEWQISAEVAQQAAQVGSTGYNQPHVRLVIGTAGQACSARRLSGLAHGFLSDHELAARDISLVEACELLAATPACTRPAWRSTRATRSRCTTSHHLLLPLKCQHPFALSGRRVITGQGSRVRASPGPHYFIRNLS